MSYSLLSDEINMQDIVNQVVRKILLLHHPSTSSLPTAAQKEVIQNIKYKDVRNKIKDCILKRNLSKTEKQNLTSCIKICKNGLIVNLLKSLHTAADITTQSNSGGGINCISSNSNGNKRENITTFIVLTAYTQNYTIGALCSAINKRYCNLYNYQFIEQKINPATLQKILGNRNHCTWYKIHLILKFMNDKLSSSNNNTNTYIVWLDADACVINDKIKLEDIVKLGEYRDLIIAEDQSFLINCGVMLIRICDWSCMIFSQVWDEKKYFKVPHFEQSALIRVLKRHAEGLNLIARESYFTKDGGNPIKLFVHTAVLAPSLLNTNVHDDDVGAVHSKYNQRRGSKELATFIYHPYGKSKKIKLVHKMMSYHNIKLEDIDPFSIEVMKVNKGYTNEAIKQAAIRLKK
jgi:hypothetical protein